MRFHRHEEITLSRCDPMGVAVLAHWRTRLSSRLGSIRGCSAGPADGSMMKSCFGGHRQWKVTVKVPTAVRSIAILFLSLASPLHAQAPLLDPNLPNAKPQALQHLSDNRVRQRIMQESQARYGGRCVCPYQTKDLKGHSCKGRHEVITTPPRPICYPSQVTGAMVSDWRRHH